MTTGDRFLVAHVGGYVVVLDAHRKPASPYCFPTVERFTGDPVADVAQLVALANRIARALNVDEEVAASVRDATRGLDG